MSRRGLQAGFTLVELIIALTLTALIVAALGSALHGLGQGFSRSTEQAARTDRIVRASQALRHSLSRAAAPPVMAPGAQVPPLQGDRTSLEWRAPLPESSPVPGLFRWRLSVQGGDLVVSIDASGDEMADMDATPPPSRLVDDLRRFQIFYQNADTGQWTDRWSEIAPPLRVRLLIETDADGPWPPVVVRLGQPA